MTDFDVLIKDACSICVESDLESFLSSTKKLGIFASFTIRKRISKNKTSSLSISKKRIVLIAVVLSALIALTACAAIPAIRNSIKNFVTHTFNGGVLVETSAEDPTAQITDIMLPSYTPDGFARGIKYSKGMTMASYSGNDASFTFCQLISEYSVMIKVNEAKKEAIPVNGSEYNLYNLSENSLAIMWTDGMYQYLISGNGISQSELIKIAESVAKHEK